MLIPLMLSLLLADVGGFSVSKAFEVQRAPVESKPAAQKIPDWQMLAFGATWCGNCLHEPSLKHLRKSGFVISDEGAGHIRTIDVDRERGMQAQYRITSLPTFVILQHGKEVHRHVGKLSANDVAKLYNNSVQVRSAVAKYRTTWPGMTERSLREHLAGKPHNINTNGWSFQQMIDWHDKAHGN